MYAKSGYAFAADTPGTLQGESFTIEYAGWSAMGEAYLTADWGDKTPVTFTAAETGGTSGKVNSTGIVLTFSEPIEGLLGTDITITDGSGSATGGVLEGSGTTWTLPLSSVDKQGTVTVTIANFGDFVITSGPQLVTVYRYIEPGAGVTVSGEVTSYNPKNPVTIELKQGGTAVYTETIAALGSGFERNTQSFSIEGVEAGTYDLVVTKTGHLSYTITGVVVSGTDLDLITMTGKVYSDIVMIAGDVNDDGLINASDLSSVLNNYLKSPAASEPLADLNGDNFINSSDLALVLNNYVKKSLPVIFES